MCTRYLWDLRLVLFTSPASENTDVAGMFLGKSSHEEEMHTVVCKQIACTFYQLHYVAVHVLFVDEVSVMVTHISTCFFQPQILSQLINTNND